jgi:[acyl-carrier-protein] S-malonyltransferase
VASDSFIAGGLRARSCSPCVGKRLQSGAVRAVMLPIADGLAYLAAAIRRARGSAADCAQASRAASVSPGVRLLSGVDADLVADLELGLDKLARQISQTLDWSACLTACQEAGATRVLELGPGKALASMARAAIPQARCRSLEDFKTLDGARAWLTA